MINLALFIAAFLFLGYLFLVIFGNLIFRAAIAIAKVMEILSDPNGWTYEDFRREFKK